MQWHDTIRNLTEKLVAIPSISNEYDPTPENNCAAAIASYLTADTDLQTERMTLSPTDQRVNVYCLLRGTHPASNGDTVILMGHYDTVGVKEFVSLGDESLAFDPTHLHQVLQEKSQRAMPDEAIAALLNGDSAAWMFGRGVFDMKSGIAVNIAVIRALAQVRDQLVGNVLFLACPDEENESAGILAAVHQLQAIADRDKLTYIGAINSDYTAPRTSQDRDRFIYTGTIGKLLPSFYILGDTTHVGEPFRGVDASRIAAQLVSRINLAPALADRWENGDQIEVAVPPITLKMRDLKSEYNVQTANEAYVYVNWLTYTRTPGEALTMMVNEASAALELVLNARRAAYQEFIALGGEVPEPKPQPPRVYTFEDLCKQLCEKNGWSAGDLKSWLHVELQKIRDRLDDYEPAEAAIHDHLADRVDNRERSRLLVAALIEAVELKGPAVVVYFAPPYYPHIKPQDNRITQAVEAVLQTLHDETTLLGQKFAADQGSDTVQMRGFYPYISDISYVRIDEDIAPHLPALTANMPLYDTDFYRLPLDEIAALNCPVVNIGPYGHDAHGLYERVYTPYSFEVLPQLVYDSITRILSG